MCVGMRFVAVIDSSGQNSWFSIFLFLQLSKSNSGSSSSSVCIRPLRLLFPIWLGGEYQYFVSLARSYLHPVLAGFPVNDPDNTGSGVQEQNNCFIGWDTWG